MARKFKHVSHSTGSDDGLWMAWDAENRTMRVIEFAHWEDRDSSFDGDKYNVQAGLVFLDRAEDSLIRDQADALQSCGFEFSTEADVALQECPVGSIVDRHSGDVVCRADAKNYHYFLAGCMWGYGAKEVWNDIRGNNRNQLMRAARRELAQRQAENLPGALASKRAVAQG